ncbi:MAG: hypothetical protein B6244_05450 [Candidatus Cloacimonetes bacterium 4572_55]|nr:MAG: hypothetical protein B6244_05450 [Candidatus Cloacimonetes bacterium 4572_55]
MHIAVDAMGGDHTPAVNIEGAIEALKCQEDLSIILVGDEKVINPLVIPYYQGFGDRLSIRHASEVITMHDSPAQALRKKKDSSVNVMYGLHKTKQVAAVISSGNTGAMITGGLMTLRRLKGVRRPSLAGVLPTEQGISILLDSGANVNCKPTHLVQFAEMGAIYCQRMLDKDTPRVGLLNIGEEPTKGNELALETYELLSELPLNFIGNVEGRDIFKGVADVIVCDGFIGNIVLKFAEGTIGFLKSALRKHTSKSWLAKGGLLLLAPTLAAITKMMDYSEYGGAPLLGLNGVSVVCHGGSNAKALKNGILVARRFVENQVNQLIQAKLTLK